MRIPRRISANWVASTTSCRNPKAGRTGITKRRRTCSMSVCRALHGMKKLRLGISSVPLNKKFRNMAQFYKDGVLRVQSCLSFRFWFPNRFPPGFPAAIWYAERTLPPYNECLLRANWEARADPLCLLIKEGVGWPLRMLHPWCGAAIGAQAHRQRHEHSGCHGEWLGLEQFKHGIVARYFQMGVPISARTCSPRTSPLQPGIRFAPTKTATSPQEEIDFLIAMNAKTAQDDVMSLAPGASVLYDEPLALDKLRNDLIFYSFPTTNWLRRFAQRRSCASWSRTWCTWRGRAVARNRYGEVEKAVRKQFAKKAKAANLNLAGAQAGFDYAKASLQKRGAFYIERMDKTRARYRRRQLGCGSGCMFAGCTVRHVVIPSRHRLHWWRR